MRFNVKIVEHACTKNMQKVTKAIFTAFCVLRK